MYTTKQSERWSGEFGDTYHRNNPNTGENIKDRMRFWEYVVKIIGEPKSYLEFGAGQGPNLLAIQGVYEILGKEVETRAVEINPTAKKVLEELKIEVVNPRESKADVVFTMGVLIHVHPENISDFMMEMFNASNKYIICCEYFSATTRSKSYHGWDDALWSDDYGSLWMAGFPVKVLAYGFLWDKATRLDNLVYWVMEKIESK